MKMLIFLFVILVVTICAENTELETHIVVKDDRGNIFTSYSAERFSEEDHLKCYLEGESSALWFISPEVEGVILRDYGVLIIHTDRVIPKQTFIITATTEEGNTTLPFDIEITGCKYGDYMLMKTDMTYGRMELYNGGDMVFNNTLSFSTYLCIPISTYRYVILNDHDSHYYVTMNDEYGSRYHSVVLYPHSIKEGSFSNDPKARLSISFPPVIYVSEGDWKTIPLLSQGPIDNVTIVPELEFNVNSFYIKVSGSMEEIVTYTITAFHGEESVQTTFTVYKTSCPEDYSLITLSLVGFCQYSTYTLPEVEAEAFYTSTYGFCVQDKPLHVTMITHSSCAMQIFKDGFTFFEYPLTQSTVTVTVLRHEPLTFASPLAFSTHSPAKEWKEVNFNDNAWTKGTEENWGSFASSSAWFRAPFTMDPQYTSCRVVVRGEGSISLFVNGNSFSHAVLTEKGVFFVIPPVYLAASNVFAVELTKGVSDTIQFGLSVLLSNSQLLQVMDGKASAIQPHPDPAHPPEYAFYKWEYYNSRWETDAVPAELIFTFNNGTRQVMNALQIACRIDSSPFGFDVVGVTGEERVTLASFNRDFFRDEEQYAIYTNFQFQNIRPFESYHFVFTATNLTKPIGISGILLYSQALHACPKKYGLKGILDGTTLYKGCPIGSTGRKLVTCVHENDSTFWTESREQCYPTNPPKDYEFMDWTFTIRGIASSRWKDGRPMTEMLAEETPMAGRDISYLYEDDTVDGDTTVLTVYSRCLLDRGLSAVVKRRLRKLVPRFSELVSQYYGVECTASIGKITIRHHINWALVITVSVVSVILIVAISVYLSFRNKKGEVKHLRKANNLSESENVSLLV